MWKCGQVSNDAHLSLLFSVEIEPNGNDRQQSVWNCWLKLATTPVCRGCTAARTGTVGRTVRCRQDRLPARPTQRQLPQQRPPPWTSTTVKLQPLRLYKNRYLTGSIRASNKDHLSITCRLVRLVAQSQPRHRYRAILIRRD